MFKLSIPTLMFMPLVACMSVPMTKGSTDDQFQYGVSSGDVTSDGAVIWTGIKDDDDDNDEVLLEVELSTSSDFDKIDFKSATYASERNDFTAKVAVTGLHPDQLYYYRWRHGSDLSETGKFKTAPSPSDISSIVKFAWSGDSDASKKGDNLVYGDWELLEYLRIT